MNENKDTATLFINGAWKEGSGSFPVKNPSNDKVIGYAAEASSEDVNSAMMAAKQAQKSWELTPVFEKAAYLKKLMALTEEHKETLAKLIQRNKENPMGSPLERWGM